MHHNHHTTLFISSVLLLFSLNSVAQSPSINDPEQYLCAQAKGEITIDGKLDDKDWASAPWTEDFVDIEGSKKPLPLHRTRAKMLWDDNYFYIAAEIIEPDIWATYTERDAIIYHENDFEVFIDPDGDTHKYYELEINALGTVWDLMVIKPYRDGGPAIDAWDISGLKKGITIDGTINDPSDTDRVWYVELALPWKILKEAAPERRKPNIGETWFVNFSRVNWRVTSQNGSYTKEVNPDTQKSYPEYNWVWSPQGVIAMHQPETWGMVTFTKNADSIKTKIIVSEHKKLLRTVYLAQKEFKQKNSCYSTNIELLNVSHSNLHLVNLSTTPSFFEAWIEDGRQVWHIDHDGRSWITPNKRPENNN